MCTDGGISPLVTLARGEKNLGSCSLARHLTLCGPSASVAEPGGLGELVVVMLSHANSCYKRMHLEQGRVMLLPG